MKPQTMKQAKWAAKPEANIFERTFARYGELRLKGEKVWLCHSVVSPDFAQGYLFAHAWVEVFTVHEQTVWVGDGARVERSTVPMWWVEDEWYFEYQRVAHATSGRMVLATNRPLVAPGSYITDMQKNMTMGTSITRYEDSLPIRGGCGPWDGYVKLVWETNRKQLDRYHGYMLPPLFYKPGTVKDRLGWLCP